jgi:hypothetical protein
MAIATLTVDFVAKIADLQRDFDKAAQIAQKNAAKIEGAFNTIGVSLASLGVGLSVGGIVAGVRNMVGAFDDLEEAAQRVGVGAVALSELRTAARLSGVDAEKLDTSLSKLNVKLADAAGGSKDAVAAFRAIGVSFQDANLNVRDTEAVLRDIASRFSTFRDGAEKSALAVEFFGRSGDKLVPFLNQSADGLRRFSGLSEETVREAARMQLEFDRLSVTAERLKNSFAAALIPQFNRFHEAIQRISIVEFGKDFLISPINALLKFQNDLRLSLRTVDTLRAAVKSAGSADTLDARDLRLLLGAAPVIPKDTTVKKDDISDAARELANFIDQLERQIEKTAELTNVERGLALIRANPALETAQVRELVQVMGERADAANRELQIRKDNEALVQRQLAAEKALTDQVFELTGIAEEQRKQKLTEQLEILILQSQAQEAASGVPILSNEQIERAVKGIAGIRDEVKKTDDIVHQLGLTFTSAFEDAIVGGRKFSEILNGLAQDILRLFIRRQVSEPLFNFFSGQIGGGGFSGGGGGGAPAAGGGGFGGGVISAGNRGASKGMTVIYNINQVGSGITRADVASAMEQTRNATIASLTDLRARGRLSFT